MIVLVVEKKSQEVNTDLFVDHDAHQQEEPSEKRSFVNKIVQNFKQIDIGIYISLFMTHLKKPFCVNAELFTMFRSKDRNSRRFK